MASTDPVHGPWRRRLVVRYAATLAAVALGSAVLFGAPLYELAARQLELELDDRLEGTAELSALLIGPVSREEWPERLALVMDEADLDAICLLDEDGRVIAQAPDDGDCGLEPSDHDAAERALNVDSTHTAIRGPADAPYLLAFAPLGAAGTANTVVAVRGAAPYLARLQELRRFSAAATPAWMAVVLGLGVWSASRLVRPVHRLIEATERLKRGAPPQPPQSGGPLELDTLEASFAEMAGAVRRRETELRALAGAVAHEVRNPAHALRLHLGLLRRHLADPPERLGERMATLEHELDLLEGTVEAFLVFARDQTAHRTDCDLGEVLRRWADGAPVEAPSVRVPIDPVLIGRAVANLIRNAREAGGEPLVRATVGDEVVIEVEDHGPGFRPDIVARAFEPFVSGRPGGSGLGLAIVAAIARAHGGQVAAEVANGSTVVRMRLPAH